MATISIADNDARVQYTQAVTANSTTLTIDFPFFNLDDIKVIATTSAGVDTTLSRGSGTGTFAVSGTSVDDGYSGGSITLGDSYANTYTYTIYRDITASRTTDFATSGPFNISSLNTELDKIYAIIQQIETENNRALTLPSSDATASIILPPKASRLNKYLAFHETTGLAVVGGNVTDTGTVASQSANISTLAGINANITTVAGISSNVTTVAGISSNVTTVAGIQANVTTVAGANSNVTTVANNIASVNTVATDIAKVIVVANDLNEAVSEIETAALDLQETTSEIDVVANNIANVNTVGGISGNVTTVAGIQANVTTLATGTTGGNANLTQINAVADNLTNVNAVATNATNINNLNGSGVIANIATVGGISSNVTTVAGIHGNVTTVAGIASDVTAVANDATDIGAVAGKATEIGRLGTTDAVADMALLGVQAVVDDMAILGGSGVVGNIATVAGISSNVTTVAGIQANVTTVAGISSNVSTVAGISSNVTTVAGDSTEITAVAGNSTNINAVAGNATNISAVAGNSTNINAVNSNATNINSVAGAISNVNTVGGAISNVNTVATNLSSINDFADKYRIGSSDPGSANDEGDLFYNTSSNTLKVYTGSAWEAGVTAGSGFAPLSGATFTGDVTLSGDSYNAVWDKSDNALEFADDAKLTFGTGSDLQIYHDSSDNKTYIKESGSHNFYLQASNFFVQNSAGSKNYIYGQDGADVRLYYDGNQKLVTTNTGIDVNGNAKADSLSIDHASNDWNFELSGADLVIKNGSTTLFKLDTSGNLTVAGDITTDGSL
nr:putative tail fiber protein [uncultured Mediterranean phage uvMED]